MAQHHVTLNDKGYWFTRALERLPNEVTVGNAEELIALANAIDADNAGVEIISPVEYQEVS
jgi:hypothetical protein